MPDELDSLLTFVLDLLRDYGLDDFYLELSTRNPEKYVGDRRGLGARRPRCCARPPSRRASTWCSTPAAPRSTARRSRCRPRDAIGRTWQMSTIQVDFNLPELFELRVPGRRRHPAAPVMIHRALFGSIERFFAVLLEHYAGAFPPWLAPVQVVGIPITDAHVDYLARVARPAARGRGSGSRSTASDDRMQKKIRNAQQQKVPYMLIAGDEDVAAGAVSFRYRDGSQNNGVAVDEAVAEIVAAVEPPRSRSERADGPTGSAAWDRLWTPHRMAYIRGENKPTHDEAGDECPFCAAPARTTRRPGRRARRARCTRVLNLYPYNAGHLMVCPYRHVADYTELDAAEVGRARRASPSTRCGAARGVRRAGLQHRDEPGPVAGAGIAGHLHQHVVPRWGGDTNFMPVVGGTKSMPELLPRTRELLAAAWRLTGHRRCSLGPGTVERPAVAFGELGRGVVLVAPRSRRRSESEGRSARRCGRGEMDLQLLRDLWRHRLVPR